MIIHSLLRTGLVVAALLVIGRAARRQKASQQIGILSVQVEGQDSSIFCVGVRKQIDSGCSTRPDVELETGGVGHVPRFIAVMHFPSPCRAFGVPDIADADWVPLYTSPRRHRSNDHA